VPWPLADADIPGPIPSSKCVVRCLANMHCAPRADAATAAIVALTRSGWGRLRDMVCAVCGSVGLPWAIPPALGPAGRRVRGTLDDVVPYIGSGHALGCSRPASASSTCSARDRENHYAVSHTSDGALVVVGSSEALLP
jgi:hypothetical protein